MIPFSPLVFPDDMVSFRSVYVTGGQGAARATFPEAGAFLKASVQSKAVDRMGRNGRVATATVHTVRTPDDPEAVAGDKFLYRDHDLAVEGHTEPGGIGDVIWITPCLETR